MKHLYGNYPSYRERNKQPQQKGYEFKNNDEELRSRCPNCREKYDGIECLSCGFDTGCYDPNWD